ncbi:MAG: malectin domain-containing carbohydrate-binding protein, partial [Planctomycetota bacterium]|nr:malectin domain-containing carbohydrate-binding protein [Planctomycetota bacterium]
AAAAGTGTGGVAGGPAAAGPGADGGTGAGDARGGRSGLAGAEVRTSGEGGLTILRRVGPLPGSAPWTHQYGDAANSLKSDDFLVRLPLGILWFGGSSHEDVLPRHGHGPPPQIIGGRLFIQGLDSLSARDVYTGRILWKTKLDRLGTFGIYYDETHHEDHTGLDYNQRHIPGANARGTNFVAAADALYVIQGAECTVLDAVTGRKKSSFRLLRPDGSPASAWGYIAIGGDLLIGGADFAEFADKAKETDPRLAYRFPREIYDRVASKSLVAMDRKTGGKLWGIQARYSFLHNGIAIGGGRLYCLDRIPPFAHNALAAAGQAPPADAYSISALDLRTGRPLWRTSANIFGSWLGYSKGRDILIQAFRPGRDMIEGEAGSRITAYRASDGTVLWDRDIRYWTPLILHGDRIITGSEMVGLLDGRPVMRRAPLTGIECPWTYRKGYGCDYPIASEHLLTFRSGAAGFCDLSRDAGFGNFGGFKSGCTSNLIAADGLLNAPDYTRTCSCSYQNQTSLGLVHMPEIEMWTAYECVGGEGPIKRLGVNFGAPGFRLAGEGIPWVPYPDEKRVGPCVEIEREPADVRWFRRHSSRVSGESPAWVAASGGIGIRRVSVFLDTRDVGSLGRSIAVTSKSDDAHEDVKEGMAAVDGTILDLASPGGTRIAGIRFADVRVARGSRVKRAYVQFSSARDGTGKAKITIAGEAADNAAPFRARKKEISGRRKTAASVTWEPPDWTDEEYRGPAQRTPNLAAILQEIFDRPGWEPGNAVALIIRGEGKRVAFSFDGDKDGAPVLAIECAGPGEDGRERPMRTFAVRLHFLEPEAMAAGERFFSVAIQGKEVLTDLDVVKEAGGRMRSIVREFGGIRASDSLSVELKPSKGLPVLCGLEIIER